MAISEFFSCQFEFSFIKMLIKFVCLLSFFFFQELVTVSHNSTSILLKYKFVSFSNKFLNINYVTMLLTL